MLDNKGQRFCNELGRRDYVTGEMWNNKAGPYRLLLNGKASKEIEWHCKHYVGRGLMKRFEDGASLAKEFGLDASVLKKTFDEYNTVAKAGTDKWGKKFFHNAPFTMNEVYHVAIVTPVIHYCMGGIQIDTNSNIIRDDGTPILGLYAAGEVAGGVHGKNRLGGSGLLGCVVFGRVSGAHAARHLLKSLSDVSSSISSTTNRRVGALGRQLQIIINLDGGDVNVLDSSSSSSSSSSVPAPSASKVATPAPVVAATTKATSGEYTMDEVAKHNTDKDCWVVVNGEVLNVTDFLDRHPGGKGSIMLFAGRDASEEFNMLHKPDVISKFAPQVVIGKLKK
jgi:cytochrome b involved in lipid metabolism